MIAENRHHSRAGAQRRPSDESSQDFKTLFGALADDANRWMRQEIALAKSEIRRTAKEATRQATRMATGIVGLAAGAILLVVSLAAGISTILIMVAGMAPSLAVFIATFGLGLVTFLAGLILFQHSKKQLSAEKLKPRKTAESLIETKNWATSKIQ